MEDEEFLPHSYSSVLLSKGLRLKCPLGVRMGGPKWRPFDNGDLSLSDALQSPQQLILVASAQSGLFPAH